MQNFSHVRFIGGGTDSGKTTVANLLAARHGVQLYHYDRTDLRHHQRLAHSDAAIRAFMNTSLDENWLLPTPQDLMQRSLRSFELRFPLVIEDLLALPNEPLILAEGFGLTPALLAPLLTDQRQAIWFFSTAAFKRDSMARRGKPSFGNQISDPQRARQNLFKRDRLLSEHLAAQAKQLGLRAVVVDGTQTPEELAGLVEQHFKWTSHDADES